MSAGRTPDKAITPFVGLKCEPGQASRTWECAGAGYTVSGSEDVCDEDSSAFGAVRGTVPLDALDRLGRDARAVAKLAPGQLVCGQYAATGNTSDDRWMYVVAVPTSLVSACEVVHCGDPEARSRRISGEDTPCRILQDGYGSGCAAGWVKADAIDEFSMGLGGRMAEMPLPPASVTNLEALELSLPGVNLYNAQRYAQGICAAGAQGDDLGRQTAAVYMFKPGTTDADWSVMVPRHPEFHQNRATHCACTDRRCYALIATDTQAAPGIGQTLLSVVAIDLRGDLIEQRTISNVDGVPSTASIWVGSDPNAFQLQHNRLAVRGHWRLSQSDDPKPFTTEIGLF